MSLVYTIKFDKYNELLVHNSDQESLPPPPHPPPMKFFTLMQNKFISCTYALILMSFC